MKQPSLFDAATCSGRACLADAVYEVRTGVAPFKPACRRCAARKRRWAASPGLSGLRFQRRPLGDLCRTA